MGLVKHKGYAHYYGKPYRKGFVYILRCANGFYYTNATANLGRSVSYQTSNPKSGVYRRLHPQELVYFEEFEYMKDALDRMDEVRAWPAERKNDLVKGRAELASSVALACYVLEN